MCIFLVSISSRGQDPVEISAVAAMMAIRDFNMKGEITFQIINLLWWSLPIVADSHRCQRDLCQVSLESTSHSALFQSRDISIVVEPFSDRRICQIRRR